VRSTFVDPTLDEAIRRDGFVIVPLLNADEVKRLNDLYDSLGVAPGDPQCACVDTFHSFDVEYKKRVHEEVEQILGPAAQRHLDRYRSISFCFVQKWPGDRSGFGLHQDISVLDESKALSVEVWCALTDTNEENGQLWITPGSHRWVPEAVRGIHSHPPVFSGLEERIISRHSKPVPMKAGDAVIFAHATYHFSFANASQRPRLVAATDMIPEEMGQLHYVENDAGLIDVLEIEDSFWVEQNPFTLRRAPSGIAKVGEVDPAEFHRLTADDLDRLVSEGHAIDREAVEFTVFNDPDRRWCHRCGSDEGVDGNVDPLKGNVTLLCRRCAAAQARLAGVLGDVDPELLRRVADDGFAVVDLFDEQELVEVSSLIESLEVPESVGFYAMNRDAPRSVATATSAALLKIGQGAVDRVLPGYRVCKAIPIVKGARGDNPVALHQDWSYADEREARGVGIWCPLAGATATDGGLAVVPGSHRWLDEPRGSNFPELWNEVADEAIRRGSVSIDLLRGQAVVYDNSLLHHTPPNCGTSRRDVLALAAVPPGAATIHYYSPDGHTGEMYRIAEDDTHFTSSEFGSRPAGQPLRSVALRHDPVSISELDSWLPEPLPERVAEREPARVAERGPEGWVRRLSRLRRRVASRGRD
jgi:ectoine hydroxylase-related dioxygenase (phytanoyl-CoA dioxygenase family)